MTAFGLEGLRPDVAKAVELILRIVGGDFGARGEVTGSGDDLDAVIVALNMMAESFQVERSGRERAEALLADAVDAYEHAPDLFCSCEPEGLTVIKCNQTMADTLGLETQGVLGAPRARSRRSAEPRGAQARPRVVDHHRSHAHRRGHAEPRRRVRPRS
jgi:hypothetical protein